MAKHAVIRTDRMFGTNVCSGLVSFKYMGAGSTATAIDNANVVLLNGLLEVDSAIPDREVFKAVTPSADSDLKDVVLVAGVETFVDGLAHDLSEYTNAAGKIVRGYHLHTNDIFSATEEAFDGTPEVGSAVELEAGTKLKVVASATSGSTTIGKIIEESTIDGRDYFAVLVN